MVAAGVLATSASASYMVYVGGGGGNVFPLATDNGGLGLPIPIHVSTGCGPFGSGSEARSITAIAISPSGARAYVANGCDNLIAPISLATDTTQKTIAVGSDPVALAITPDGSTAYVVNKGDDTVTPIALATNTPGPAIPVGSRPTSIAITPNGSTAYVVNSAGGTVTPIALATNTPGPPIRVGRNLNSIAITPDGQTAYVTTAAAGEVIPVALSSNMPEAPIAVGPHPTGIAITPDGTLAYVLDQAGVTPITLSTGTAGGPLDITGDSIAITPDGQHAYVTDGGAVWVISIPSNGFGVVNLPRFHNGVAIAISPVVLRSTSTSVSCSPNPVEYDATTNCTATVTDTDAGTPATPTGRVHFEAGANERNFSQRACTLAGSGDSASCSVDFTAPRIAYGDSIGAVYNGDAVYSLSTDVIPLFFEADATSTTLQCDQTTLMVGQSTNCTVTVTNLVGAPFISKGHVAFSGSGDDQFSPAFCKIRVPGPTATCQTTYTPTASPGQHTITAQTTFYSARLDQPSSQSLPIDVQPSP